MNESPNLEQAIDAVAKFISDSGLEKVNGHLRIFVTIAVEGSGLEIDNRSEVNVGVVSTIQEKEILIEILENVLERYRGCQQQPEGFSV